MPTQPSAVECAYAAGIVDGEGTLELYKRQVKDRWIPQYNIRVAVTNTNFALLDWLQARFGGRFSSKPTNLGRRPLRTWRLMANQALAFVRLILPYLIVK